MVPVNEKEGHAEPWDKAVDLKGHVVKEAVLDLEPIQHKEGVVVLHPPFPLIALYEPCRSIAGHRQASARMAGLEVICMMATMPPKLIPHTPMRDGSTSWRFVKKVTA